jgi:hypothetical protein
LFGWPITRRYSERLWVVLFQSCVVLRRALSLGMAWPLEPAREKSTCNLQNQPNFADFLSCEPSSCFPSTTLLVASTVEVVVASTNSIPPRQIAVCCIVFKP